MKSFILLIALAFSTVTFAESSYIDAREDLTVLSLVVTPLTTYSQASGLQASVIPLLAGDGLNAIRMALVVSDGMGSSYVYELGEMVNDVTRITFSGLDTITINYTQDSFDANENQIEVKGSVTVQALRFKDGTLSDSLKILK